MKEKMEAGIFGFTVGDALGVPVEFLSRDILEKEPVNEMLGYGSHGVPAGTWSDDTSLMLAAMDSIGEKSDINYDDIMKRFSDWFNKGTYTADGKLFDIGNSTRKAIYNYKRGINVLECGTKGERDNGNGSLMRILPFVYFLHGKNLERDNVVDIINKGSSLTHAHEISRLGCLIFNDYISLILDGYNKKDAFDALRDIDYSPYYSTEVIQKYERILTGKLLDESLNAIKSGGFVVHTLEASLYCTIKCSSYEDAVEMAVNLGNDTDTTGAVTGAINGILYGKDAIPKRWLSKIRNIDYLEKLISNYLESLDYGKKF